MRLDTLLPFLPWPRRLDEAVEISGISSDSRQVKPGHLFVAIKGLEHDGHKFIPQAQARGAAALVVEKGARFPKASLPTVVVPDSRQALAYLASAWYGAPSERLHLVGVTGTDGKTTTSSLIRAILEEAGHPTGLITSVSAVIGKLEVDTGFHTTTPEAMDTQKYLARMVKKGCQYAVIEATSHGLAQHRLEACHFDVAVLTNITHEHLDYHKTFKEYQEAKAQLFRSLSTSIRKPETLKVSILNAEDPSYEYFDTIPADLRLTYSIEEPAAVMAGNVELAADATSFTAHTPSGSFSVEMSLVGEFNLRNALAAIATAISQSISPEDIQEAIAKFKGVIGRMERIDLGQPFAVVIDFAHTPNALENALKTARHMTRRSIIAVFGCAGLRDFKKRPIMGELAGKLADRVVITAEDPRTEDLAAIMSEIAKGCRKVKCKEGEDFWRIGDRGEAIQFAIDMARPGDLVVITGKGHEKSMCFGTEEYPWSDHKAAREAIRNRMGD